MTGDILREGFEEALAREPADAFHIAFKAEFRAAEFRDGECLGMKGSLQPATDEEILNAGEHALKRALK